MGKVIELNGRDLRRSVSVALEQAAAEITNEYNEQMPVESTQALYDSIIKHSRSDIRDADAVARALKETYPTPPMAPPLSSRYLRGSPCVLEKVSDVLHEQERN